MDEIAGLEGKWMQAELLIKSITMTPSVAKKSILWIKVAKLYTKSFKRCVN